MQIRRKILVPQLVSYGVHRQPESADKLFALKFNISHKLQLMNVQYNFCPVTCYNVLIWTLILLTLGNNIVILLFNWPKPVHYIPTDKINASIRIRIRQILKVKFAFNECKFWLKFAFDECEFRPASSHHCSG